MNALKQYKVKWDGRELLLYAQSPDDARRNAEAPPTATVEESFLSDHDLRSLLMRGGKK